MFTCACSFDLGLKGLLFPLPSAGSGTGRVVGGGKDNSTLAAGVENCPRKEDHGSRKSKLFPVLWLRTNSTLQLALKIIMWTQTSQTLFLN